VTTTLLIDGNRLTRAEQRVLVAEGKKQCTGCLEVKPLEQYGKATNGLGGRASQCNTCKAEKSRQYRKDNPDPHKNWDAGRYQRRKREMRDRFLQRTYGVTLERFEEMVEEQQGGCALCGRTPDPEAKGNSGSLHMDHDHETGSSRRPLCHDCNNGLGRFLDDPDLLERAADYIRSFR
jgi:hypothetical protein